MTTENRPAFTAGLRAVADFLDEHPEVPLPYLGGGAAGSRLPAFSIYLVSGDQKTQLAAIARAMGNAVKAPKKHHDGSESFQVWREFEGVVLFAQAEREQVCRRVVTGTEDREVEEVVTPAVTRKVTKPVEVVTWECLPLLAADASDVVEDALEADPDGVADAVAEGIAAPGTAQPEDIPTLTECTNCHLIGTPADMDPVTFATFEHGPGGTRWYCRDITACGTRARTAKAGAR